jgi:hypothetical protein
LKKEKKRKLMSIKLLLSWQLIYCNGGSYSNKTQY